MISANFMNVASVKNGKVQQVASKKAQDDSVQVAEVFAGIMNQTMDASNCPSKSEELCSNRNVSKSETTSSSYESYDRYSYKKNQIEQVENVTQTDKFEASTDTLEQVAEEVVETICDAYHVEEETVQNLLDEMGLSPLDLLSPQNLVSFLTNLTGIASSEQLLWDENYLKVMEMVNGITENLMQNLDVDADGLQEMIAQMDNIATIEEQEVLPEDSLEMPLEQNKSVDKTIVSSDIADVKNESNVLETVTEEAKMAENVEASNVLATEEMNVSTEGTEILIKEEMNVSTEDMEIAQQLEASEEVLESAVKDGQVLEVETENTKEVSELQVQVINEENTSGNGALAKEFSFTEDNHGSKKHSMFQQNMDANEAILTNQTPLNANQPMDVPQMQFAHYLSADTMQIMEQVVQQMKVNVTAEMTSMEMQMNPENLGKIFVNITTEEGIVNAKFQATSEVVKEALELQIATLRENLNQAGVKVDAIEVTVASHEFERNLEQNHHSGEEQSDGQTNTQTTKRRNLTIDSLDELSGLMTEEELLVAQMMKDNGNTVDLTA